MTKRALHSRQSVVWVRLRESPIHIRMENEEGHGVYFRVCHVPGMFCICLSCARSEVTFPPQRQDMQHQPSTKDKNTAS